MGSLALPMPAVTDRGVKQGPLWSRSPLGALAIILVVFLALALPSLGLEVQQARRDLRTLPFWSSAETALQHMESRDFWAYMRFARREIPPSASILMLFSNPSYGYYRGAYDLYPRHAWSIVPVRIVSTEPLRSHTRPRVDAALLLRQLRISRATYLVVWQVPLPSDLSTLLHPIRTLTFQPGRYIVQLPAHPR